jgi:hypothetical protein
LFSKKCGRKRPAILPRNRSFLFGCLFAIVPPGLSYQMGTFLLNGDMRQHAGFTKTYCWYIIIYCGSVSQSIIETMEDKIDTMKYANTYRNIVSLLPWNNYSQEQERTQQGTELSV